MANLTSKKKAWISIIILMLVLAIGTAGYFLYQKHQQQLREEQAKRLIEKLRAKDGSDGPSILNPLVLPAD